MHGIVTFILVTVLILGALAAFVVILIGGWIVGTVYMWIEGAGDVAQDPEQLIAWNRSKKTD